MERCTGQSTCIIDEAVQALFTIGECIVVDYYYEQGKQLGVASEHTFRRLLKRLEFEHRLLPGKGIEIDASKCKVKLSNSSSQWQPNKEQLDLAEQRDRVRFKSKGGFFL